MTGLPAVFVKERRARPFFYGHPWVFSGAIERVEGKPRNGDTVDVFDAQGGFIARGFYNSRSQIRVRLLTWDQTQEIDAAFFLERIRRAEELRSSLPCLRDTTALRLVFGESDELSGLVVDRYDEFLVVQYLSRGMDRHRQEITNALVAVTSPKGIYERSDVRVRQKEGVTEVTAHRWGEAPPDEILITENGLRFAVDIKGGQKTGFYLDQRENRATVARYARGRRVLDCFTYSGAFAITVRALGHSGTVRAIDSSAGALALAARNAALNHLNGIEWVQDDAFAALRRHVSQGERFGMVILDPPKFAYSRSEVPSALRGLKDISLHGLRLLEPGGILVSCSCSQHISAEALMDAINEAAVDARRTVRILEQRGQAPDHPVISSCPQTAYLKCLICYVE